MRGSKLLGVNVSAEEFQYVRHAAELACLSQQQFVKRAINSALRKMGVDAVLLRLKEDPRCPVHRPQAVSAPSAAGMLRAYVQHKPDCDLVVSYAIDEPRCTCGLDKALALLSSERTAKGPSESGL